MNSSTRIFCNGKFLLPDGTYGAAVEVDGAGIIRNIFKEEQVAVTTGERVDMGGNFVIPAFEDAHNHIAARARTVFEINLRNKETSWNEARELIRERAQKTPAGGWVVCHGWNEMTWGPVDQGELDTLSDVCGIFLINISFHGGLVNKKGSELLTKNGYPAGESGRITEAEFDSVIIATSPGVEAYMQAIPELQRRLLALGIGALHDMHILTLEQLEAFRRLERDGLLLFPVVLYMNPRLLAFPKEISQYRAASGDMAKLLGLKLFLDGAIGVSTAAINGQYSDGTGKGVLRHSDDECMRYISEAAALGLEQVAMHCIGDKAVEQAVSLFEKCREMYSSRIRTWRFEHFEMPGNLAIQTVAAHGGIASMQPNFSWDAGNYSARLGTRASAINPLRTIVDANVTLVLGSDDAPSGPLEGMRWAVAKAPHDIQRLTIREALRCYTETPAEIVGCGHLRGKIALGYEANFTVLDKDPLKQEAWQKSDATHVREVWIKGRRLYTSTRD